MEKMIINIVEIISTPKIAFILSSIIAFVIVFVINRNKQKPIDEKHCQKMKKMCLDFVKEISEKSTLLDLFPDLTKNICQAAEVYFKQRTKLKDFNSLNERLIKGYVYDTLYEIPMQVISKIDNPLGMLANSEVAGFCIECINLWQKEVPFVPDEKIKEMKQKVKKKYGVDNDFFNSIFESN